MESHINSSTQIDIVWTTLNLLLFNLSILSYYFSMGNHRVFIVDFPISFFVEDSFIPIEKLDMRHLTLA